MNAIAPIGRTFVHASAAVLAAALVTACGGGGGSSSGLTTDIAQGYAADSATMTVSAAGSVDSATSVLETAVATKSAAGTQQQAASAEPQAAGSASGSATCAGGGNVAWNVTATDASTLGNGQLDGGETFTATYTGCKTTDDGAMLDGQLTVAVTQRDSAGIALTYTAANLKLTGANGGTYVLNGDLSGSRSSKPTGAGTQTSTLSSTGLTLNSTIGTRQASYDLKTLSWTIVRTYDGSGNLTTRTHNGTLVLDASTPRRPNASLAITTQGTLTLGSDGAAAVGSFKVVTSNNTIACTYGSGTATLTLDLGNDGTIDHTWVLTRTDFINQAG